MTRALAFNHVSGLIQFTLVDRNVIDVQATGTPGHEVGIEYSSSVSDLRACKLEVRGQLIHVEGERLSGV